MLPETWIINESFDTSNYFSYNVNFTSNGQRFTQIMLTFFFNDTQLGYSSRDSEIGLFVWILEDGVATWRNKKYRIVTFDEPVTGNLRTWLQANAIIKKEGPEMILEGQVLPPRKIEGSINPRVGGGTPPLEEIQYVTPQTSAQDITPSPGYEGVKKVHVYAVPLGTEGTPTFETSGVSNHQISLTPKVINQNGFIAGNTKRGSPVTITADDLTSGSETKIINGTYDVTNLKEIVVDVEGIVPAGTLEITENNEEGETYDVTRYSGVSVHVPTGIIPSGTLNVVENGPYDVSEYSSVNVTISTKIPNSPTAGNTPVLQSSTLAATINSTTMSATGIYVEIPKTGTYRLKYSGARTSTSGTFTVQLYRSNGTSQPTLITNPSTLLVWSTRQGSFTGDIPCTAGDRIEIWARSSSTSTYTIIGQLTASITWWKEGVD